MTLPLLDGDGLVYEVGFGTQKKEVGEDGVERIVPNSWESVQDLLKFKIDNILYELNTETPPIIFLTNTQFISSYLNRQRKWMGEEEKPFIDNFRFKVAEDGQQLAYKGNRKADKPYHYHNLIVHLLAQHKCLVNEDGLEADDAMALYQTQANKDGIDTTICSRDKDLRMVEGNYYAWEMGKQRAIGPIKIDRLGYLEPKGDGKIFGTGSKWFYAQMIIGDKTDNIQGIKGKGDMYAYKLLNNATTERECYERVKDLYEKTYKEEWKTQFVTAANLLWMVREVDDNGFVLFKPPKKEVDIGEDTNT